MARYLFFRILRGIVSVGIVVAIVMVMIYSLMNRDLIFARDSVYSHQNNNNRVAYTYSRWEEYGYLDYVPYTEWLASLVAQGQIDEATLAKVAGIGWTAEGDSELVKQYVQQFTELYSARGYTVVRKDAVTMSGRRLADGGAPLLFAYQDSPLTARLWKYFTGVITIDSIH